MAGKKKNGSVMKPDDEPIIDVVVADDGTVGKASEWIVAGEHVRMEAKMDDGVPMVRVFTHD